MHSRFVVLFIVALLMGCRALSGAPSTTQIIPAAQTTGVAWGERVGFGKPITGFEVIVGNEIVSRGTFNPARPVLDLPDAPIFPVFSSAPDPISLELFSTAPKPAERALYENRGTVKLIFSGAAPKILTPYGAVVPGQIHALASVRGSCTPFFNIPFPGGVEQNRLEVPLDEGSRLCHITFDIGSRDTAAALTALESALGGSTVDFIDSVGETGFVVDKNNLSSLDQSGRGLKSTDPSCEQIQKWLDPVGNRDYSLIDMDKLRTDIMAKGVAQTGLGVQVVIIGSGIGQADDFRCTDNKTEFFLDHDNHVQQLIKEIAPNVSFQAFKVCNAEGACSSAEIVRALMKTFALISQNPKTLVHMSLGGPRPSKPEYELLKLLGQRHDVPAVVSAGNGPFAPAHYPASFSSGLTGAPSFALPNVIPIASVGFKLNANGAGKAGYVIAGFNTRANSILFAPGVNVCPKTATSFRCDVKQAFPDDLGLTGTSFAAPVATGLAALYTEMKNALPTKLGRCLANNVRSDLITRIIAFGNKACP